MMGQERRERGREGKGHREDGKEWTGRKTP